MLIKNLSVFTPDFTFKPGCVAVQGSRFAAPSAASDDEVIDAHGLKAIPGLVDIHFHGGGGHDFMEGTPKALSCIAKYEAAVGVTTICPATMTMSEAAITKACANVRDYKVKDDGADVVGINMEGPFVSPNKVGAQNPEFVHKPDVDFFRRCNAAAGGKIKLMAIAPEEPNAIDVIRLLNKEVLSSIAHTCCSYDIACQAIAAGATHLTHCYNAMPGLAHRDPGPIAAMADARWGEAEIICDGIHIHPAAVRAAFRMLGEERMIFISDSMMAVGLEDGTYELGGQPVYVKGRLATLKSGTIAGSATNLYDCMVNAYKTMGLALNTVIRCATYNPARSIKVLDDYGTIEQGKVASMLVVDSDLNLKGVLLRGKWLYKNF